MNLFFLLLLSITIAAMNAFQLPLRHLVYRNSKVCARALTSKQLVFCYHFDVKGKNQPSGFSNKFSRRFSTEIDQEPHILAATFDTDDSSDSEPDERFDYTSTRYHGGDDDFFEEAERDANRINYPKGTPEGFYVTQQFVIPQEGFTNLVTNSNGEEGAGITQEEVNRLGISGTNITLPIALMLLDAEAYPSLSRARKSCRKGYIVVHRGPLKVNEETGEDEFDKNACFRGRVIDRVYPGGKFLVPAFCFTLLFDLSSNNLFIIFQRCNWNSVPDAWWLLSWF